MSTSRKLTKNLTGFIETRLELLKLDLVEGISGITAKIIAALIVFVLLVFVVLFLSIALAIFLHVVLESAYLGYLILGGFYLLLTVLTFLLKDSFILKKITKVYSSVFYKK